MLRRSDADDEAAALLEKAVHTVFEPVWAELQAAGWVSDIVKRAPDPCPANPTPSDVVRYWDPTLRGKKRQYYYGANDVLTRLKLLDEEVPP